MLERDLNPGRKFLSNLLIFPASSIRCFQYILSDVLGLELGIWRGSGMVGDREKMLPRIIQEINLASFYIPTLINGVLTY